MARVQLGTGVPDADDFVTILDAYKTATVTLVNSTSVTYTVSGTAYTLTGTGFAVAAGRLSAGTVTGISSSIAGASQWAVTQVSITTAELTAGVTAENGGNALALDNILADDAWVINGTNGVDQAVPDVGAAPLTADKALWYLYGGDDLVSAGGNRDDIYGGAGNDSVSGNAGDDRVLGEAGNDILYGGVGNDYVYGGDASDTAYGGDGNDVIYGGSTTESGNDKLYGDNGNDNILDGKGDGSLYGGAGKDSINGGSGNDFLYGGTDNDSVTGAAGDDRAYGEGGIDRISGGGGNDLLYGGDGTDVLIGGGGVDSLTGGNDADTFQFAASDLGIGATSDLILDFVSGEDKVNLKSMGLNFVGTAGFTAGDSHAEVRWDATGTKLEIDTNGDNVVDAHIELQVGSTLVAGDLIL